MLVLSQFGGGVTSGFIDVEVFILSGGGGGGSNGPGGSGPGSSGGGGGGAVYYGIIQVARGSTCPIQIGGGGSGNFAANFPAGPFHGGNGGYSVFTTPTGRYRVAGGGGGAGSFSYGSRGGCSGGNHTSAPNYPAGGVSPSSTAEAQAYGSFYSYGADSGSLGSPQVYGDGTGGAGGGGGGFGMAVKNGSFYGGSSPRFSAGGGGAGGGAYSTFGGNGVYTHLEGFDVNSLRGFLYGSGGAGSNSSQTLRGNNGTGRVNQGEGGDGTVNYGNGSSTLLTEPSPLAGKNGSSGVILINYPTQFGTATVTGTGNGAISFNNQWASTLPGPINNPTHIPSNEFTNSTYGVRGYKFISSGSITFPTA